MNLFYIFISFALIAAASYERILTGAANPVLVFGAIASVFYIGIEIHNYYFCKKRN